MKMNFDKKEKNRKINKKIIIIELMNVMMNE